MCFFGVTDENVSSKIKVRREILDLQAKVVEWQGKYSESESYVVQSLDLHREIECCKQLLDDSQCELEQQRLKYEIALSENCVLIQCAFEYAELLVRDLRKLEAYIKSQVLVVQDERHNNKTNDAPYKSHLKTIEERDQAQYRAAERAINLLNIEQAKGLQQLQEADSRISELLRFQHALQGDLQEARELIAQLQNEVKVSQDKVKEKEHMVEVLRRQLHGSSVKGARCGLTDRAEIIRGLESQLKVAREESPWLPMINFDELLFGKASALVHSGSSLKVAEPLAIPKHKGSGQEGDGSILGCSDFTLVSLREHNSYLQGKVKAQEVLIAELNARLGLPAKSN
ncbi:hypothetical protein GUITHDRAFT_117058 [Guillardia theta CCMP2712]|uniref:Uncharacterized protein n=1 Tax=Guillardia theta (strain CCMP2712) TaxID=905079 RepID=L1IKX1_GUITC|nr:hypothetical protein GUITHDRAFT_117058 [Guillardia theta CCMP2712]EKX36762.1 hypothetical protein GUITHDRAFT_117058 [Guillardia theta CCMP2712]|eukprot:XP_005823742.1 hypothetical protein GUITHDRAFT_117058 [Guillardia theta CCMP2712]